MISLNLGNLQRGGAGGELTEQKMLAPQRKPADLSVLQQPGGAGKGGCPLEGLQSR